MRKKLTILVTMVLKLALSAAPALALGRPQGRSNEVLPMLMRSAHSRD